MGIDRGARNAAALALSLAFLAAPGCENEGPPPASFSKIEIAALPAPILDAAKKALPGIDFKEAWKNFDKEHRLTSYEIRGRAANGKVREVRVGLDGKILETE